MHRPFLFGLVLLLTACGSAAPDTPREVWRKARQALLDADYETFANLVQPVERARTANLVRTSAGRRERLGITLERANGMSDAALLAAVIEEDMKEEGAKRFVEMLRTSRIAAVRRNGEKAKVMLRPDGEGEEIAIGMLRVGTPTGRWFLERIY